MQIVFFTNCYDDSAFFSKNCFLASIFQREREKDSKVNDHDCYERLKSKHRSGHSRTNSLSLSLTQFLIFDIFFVFISLVSSFSQVERCQIVTDPSNQYCPACGHFDNVYFSLSLSLSLSHSVIVRSKN